MNANWLTRLVCVVFVLQLPIAKKLVALSHEMRKLGRDADPESVTNTSELLNTLLSNYDKQFRPGFGGNPVEVEVNLNVRSVGPISELDMEFQMDLYFRQSWIDRRLAFPRSPLPRIQMGALTLEKLWRPDTYFHNGRQSYLHTVTVPNRFLRITREGKILYSMRLTIRACCPMSLRNFPLDVQSCPLQLGSLGYSSSDVVYRWTTTGSIQMASDMALSQFDLISTGHHNQSTLRSTGIEYSTLQANFILRRHIGYFVINVYLPCSMLVVISWVGFWINREATADRIALGITTVLTMAFLAIDNRHDLPKVSYSTALDYFVSFCYGFVLATIIQFAVVHFFTKLNSGETEGLDEVENRIKISPGVHIEANRSFGSDFHRQRQQLLTRRFETLTKRPYRHHSARKRTRIKCLNLQKKEITKHNEYQQNQNSNLSCPSPCLFKSFIRRVSCLFTDGAFAQYQNCPNNPEEFNSVSQIDRISRILFPIAFLVFQIFYWNSYNLSNN